MTTKRSDATRRGLELYDQQPEGAKNIAAAAEAVGVKAPTLHTALKRREQQKAAGKEHCPCCGQLVRDGFKVDRSVLR